MGRADVAVPGGETMKRYFSNAAIIVAAGAVLGLFSARQVIAADRLPGPESTRGTSDSQHANNHVSAHVQARVPGTGDSAGGTQDNNTAARQEDKRDVQRDWRNTSGIRIDP